MKEFAEKTPAKKPWERLSQQNKKGIQEDALFALMVSGGGHGLRLGDQSAKRLTQADALLGKTGVVQPAGGGGFQRKHAVVSAFIQRVEEIRPVDPSRAGSVLRIAAAVIVVDV